MNSRVQVITAKNLAEDASNSSLFEGVDKKKSVERASRQVQGEKSTLRPHFSTQPSGLRVDHFPNKKEKIVQINTGECEVWFR